MNIYSYDETVIDALSDLDKAAFLDDTSNRSEIIWKEKLKPTNGWAVPYVTGHRYRLTWANDLDFTRMDVEISDRWATGDQEAMFVIPFVDAREAVNVTRLDSGDQIANETLLLPEN